MKKHNTIFSRLIILLLAAITSQLCWSQDWEVLDNANYIVEYSYSLKEDSLSKDNIRTYTMSLYIGEKYSKFEHIGWYYRDSLLLLAHQSANEDVAIQSAFARIKERTTPGYFSNFRVIKNKSNDSTLLSEGPVNWTDRIKVPEYIKISWQMDYSDTKKINGYLCKKATTTFRGRGYTAWYTLEIPINDGPYKFKGLPGLIVKVEDTESQHIFELLSFKKLQYKKPIYTKTQNYRSINMSEYYQIKKTENLKFIQLFNNPEKFHTTANIGELEAKMYRRNNFIEKY